MPYTINTSDARHCVTLLETVVRGRELWRTEHVKNDKKSNDVFWVVAEDDQYQRALTLKESQRMSRIPGMRRLCEKANFARLMRSYDACAAHVPETYILPDDQIPKSAWKRPLIFKPGEGSQGEGIYLLFSERDLQRRLELCKAEEAVVQAYLDSPMLMDGYKWDCRVYVLVLSLDPLRIFVCREGLVRVCSEPYAAATARNAHHIGAHLTNYSISKYTPEFVHSDDPLDGEHGTKRTLTATLDALERRGCDTATMWDSIVHQATTTAEALAAELLGAGEVDCALWPARDAGWNKQGWAGSKELPGQHSTTNCFHILGLDIMFDSKGKAWLLEVNCSPSLAVDSVFPTTGPAAEEPAAVPEGTAHAELMHRALEVMGRKATKVCKCMSHHRPHIHHPCAVDLVAKAACVEGALLILKRDMRASGERECEDLAEGTQFVHCPLILDSL